MTAPNVAYTTWDTRKSLGIIRDVRPEPRPFADFFQNRMLSTTEYIDFEKLPVRARRLAPFVKPLAAGKGIFTDKQRSYRFKPANVVVEETVDPLRPLTFQPGLGESVFDPNQLSPMQRLELIKVQMAAEAVASIERRWEWMRARGLQDGSLTITYLDGTSVLVDFQRDAGQTEVLTGGNRFGQAGVSVMDKLQTICDTMNNAEFGGLPMRVEMGSGVWAVIRKDTEILANLDKYRPVGGVELERGVVTSSDRSRRYKVGEITLGGASGQRIELWVNNEFYEDDSGNQVKYVNSSDMAFLASPETIMGYECFGMIIDPDAQYQALPIFPKNYIDQDGRIRIEHLSFESAPLMVPINPNGTYKLTAV